MHRIFIVFFILFDYCFRYSTTSNLGNKFWFLIDHGNIKYIRAHDLFKLVQSCGIKEYQQVIIWSYLDCSNFLFFNWHRFWYLNLSRGLFKINSGLTSLWCFRQLKQATGLDNLLYTPDADFSCFADLALTSPEDFYIPGQGSFLQ